MAIIPRKDKTLVKLYWCPNCGKSYVEKKSNLLCTTIHQPGDCCHYMEAEISEEILHEIYEILNEVVPKNISMAYSKLNDEKV